MSSESRAGGWYPPEINFSHCEELPLTTGLNFFVFQHSQPKVLMPSAVFLSEEQSKLGKAVGIGPVCIHTFTPNRRLVEEAAGTHRINLSITQMKRSQKVAQTSDKSYLDIICTFLEKSWQWNLIRMPHNTACINTVDLYLGNDCAKFLELQRTVLNFILWKRNCLFKRDTSGKERVSLVCQVAVLNGFFLSAM